MKQGRSFADVVTCVENESANKADYFTPTNSLELSSQGETSQIVSPVGIFSLRRSAHPHLATICGIDARYYNRLRTEAPTLLDENVNHWLRASAGTKVLRCIGDETRAVVTPRYATLDNDALLQVLEPVIHQLDAEVAACDLNDESLIIKLVSPRLRGDVAQGDVIEAGLLVHNSEVRAGALSISMFAKRLVCENGLVLPSTVGGTYRRHLGRKWCPDTGFGQVPNTQERKTWEADFWVGVSEGIQEAVAQNSFQNLLNRLRATTRLSTRLDARTIIDRIGERHDLSEDLRDQIAGHLEADGYDGTLWDVVNGITRTAHDVKTFQLATNLESLGGLLSGMTENQWERLVNQN